MGEIEKNSIYSIISYIFRGFQFSFIAWNMQIKTFFKWIKSTSNIAQIIFIKSCFY